jgi:hypothetical protein
MSRVLIGIGAVIVLAGAVFAVVHFSSRPEPVAFIPQNGWVPVVSAVKKERGPVHVVGTFGAWRLLCRDIGPRGGGRTTTPVINNLAGAPESPAPKGHCAVALLMRHLAAPKEWLNLRLLNPATGPGAIATLAYAHGHTGKPFIAMPGSSGEEVDLRADKNIVTMWTQRCIRGVCLTFSELTPSDLDSILSAHTLVILLAPTKPTKADEVHLPTDGLRAAFTALRRQPA